MNKIRRIGYGLFILLLSFPLPLAANSSVIKPVFTSEKEALTAELKLLKEAKVGPGTYPLKLTFEENGRVIEKQTNVTIKGENTIVKADEAIDANNITVSIDQVKKLTNVDWVEQAKAKAWRTDTLQEIPITYVDSAKIKPAIGTYELCFATDIVETRVTVTVVKGVVSIDENTIPFFEEATKVDIQSKWTTFEVALYSILKISFVFMLLLPLFLLFFQYVIILRAVKKIVQMVIKK